MTPGDKAKELIKKFRDYSAPAIRTDSTFWSAKQCALIAVEEIIAQLQNMIKPDYCIFSDDNGNFLYGYDVLEYWEAVT